MEAHVDLKKVCTVAPRLIWPRMTWPRITRMWRLILAVALAAFMASLLPMGTAVAACPPVPPFASLSDRVGVNVTIDYGRDVNDYDVGYLRGGWYVDYTRRYDPSTPGGMGYVQVLRTREFDPPNWRTVIGGLVDANPGGVWVIGNEMDRGGQDGRLASRYAMIYHDAYAFIKARDPSSTVVVGAIVQPTPIRLLYLDMVLEEYEDRYGTRMPVEYWNTHGFILNESGGWGASRPPGLDHRTDLAMVWDVPDHGDIEIFKDLIVDFRTWINARGYRNTPMMVSEYGILMPSTFDAGNGQTFDYTFVRNYMLNTFNYMKDTTNSSIGYPADGNRLVQAWAWYSLNDIEYDPDTQHGSNGNLFDHDTGARKPLADDFRAFTSSGYVQYTDVVIRDLKFTPSGTILRNGSISIMLTASVINRGNLAAQNLRVQFWRGNPASGGTLLGQSPLLSSLAVRCGVAADLSFTWNPGDLEPGSYPIYAVATYQNSSGEFDASNNRLARPITVADVPIIGLSAANDGPTQLGSSTQFAATLANGSGVTYQWNFGDGFLGTGSQPVHTYSAIGEYQVTVTATNTRGSQTASTTVTVVDVPIAGLTLPAEITTNLGQVASFAATIQSGTNVRYNWQFGDGTTGTGRTPTHLYAEPGDYLVRVTASNGSSSVQATTTVHVLDLAIAGLTALNTSPTFVGTATQFSAEVAEGTNVMYSWDFGDGTSGTGETPSHVYASVGVYNATVTASNSTNSLQATTVVHIVDEGVAGLSATNNGPTELGSPTQFNVTVQDGTNASFSWAFGDGNSGTGPSPTHIYAQTGRYTATVTASNDTGTSTARTFVRIIDVPIAGLKATLTGDLETGENLGFSASVSAGTNVRYTWDFGDGTTSEGASVSHSYDLPDTYEVTLVATNSRGVEQVTLPLTITGDPITSVCVPEIDVVVGADYAEITITWCRTANDSVREFTLWRLEVPTAGASTQLSVETPAEAVQIPVEFLRFDGDKEIHYGMDTLSDLRGTDPALYQYEVRTTTPRRSYVSEPVLLTPPDFSIFLPAIVR